MSAHLRRGALTRCLISLVILHVLCFPLCEQGMGDGAKQALCKQPGFGELLQRQQK